VASGPGPVLTSPRSKFLFRENFAPRDSYNGVTPVVRPVFTHSPQPMRSALIAALLLVPSLAFGQTTVYSNTFESGSLGSEWSGAGTLQSTGGLSAFGFGALHLRNEASGATNLSLSGLGAHSSMTVRFSLAMWDSIDNGDTFSFFVGNVPLFNGTFGNYYTSSGQCEGPGTRLTPDFTAFYAPNYGYASYRDCARDVSFSFAHTASAETFSWRYPDTQGGSDESFGIDNVTISTNVSQSVVPEPSSYALLLAGLGAIGVARRRRTV
jgi:PEP-CTERM motif